MPSDKVWPSVVAALPSLGADGDKPAKVIAITGTTSGTGFEAAQQCAKQGAVVLLLNRPSERSTNSLEALKKEVPEGVFDPIDCDLASFASVDQAAEAIKAKYDALFCLANNAGVMALADQATEDGFDIQMQVNALSPFRLTTHLFPLLEAGGERWGSAKIVMHTSVARKGSALKQKYMEKNGGNLGGNGNSMFFNGARWERYHQTKLADAVFFAALADRLEARKSKVISLLAHPGVATTNLQTTTEKDQGMAGWTHKIVKFISQSQKDGACSLLKCIADDTLANRDFFGPKSMFYGEMQGPPTKLKMEKLFNNEETKELFWKTCESNVGEFKLVASEDASAPTAGEASTAPAPSTTTTEAPAPSTTTTEAPAPSTTTEAGAGAVQES